MDVDEQLTPITVIITPEVAGLELDVSFTSKKDLRPHLYLRPWPDLRHLWTGRQRRDVSDLD